MGRNVHIHTLIAGTHCPYGVRAAREYLPQEMRSSWLASMGVVYRQLHSWRPSHFPVHWSARESIGIEPSDLRPAHRRCRAIRPTAAEYYCSMCFPIYASDSAPSKWYCRLYGRPWAPPAIHYVNHHYHKDLRTQQWDRERNTFVGFARKVEAKGKPTSASISPIILFKHSLHSSIHHSHLGPEIWAAERQNTDTHTHQQPAQAGYTLTNAFMY